MASFLAASTESQELEGDYWENRTLGDSGELHAAVRERLIRMAEPEKNHLSLVLNGGDGLLLGECCGKFLMKRSMDWLKTRIKNRFWKISTRVVVKLAE